MADEKKDEKKRFEGDVSGKKPGDTGTTPEIGETNLSGGEGGPETSDSSATGDGANGGGE